MVRESDAPRNNRGQFLKVYGTEEERKEAKRQSYYKRTKEQRVRYQWADHLKRKYNLSVDEYNNLLIRQKGLCPICDRKLYKPHLDHNHTNNTIRGIICASHNKAIGLFEDNPQLLRAAADYLENRRGNYA